MLSIQDLIDDVIKKIKAAQALIFYSTNEYQQGKVDAYKETVEMLKDIRDGKIKNG